MKRSLSIILVICMALSLCLLAGCGAKYPSDSPVLGKWVAKTASAFGYEMGIEKVFDGEFSFEAKANGNANVVINGESGKCPFVFEGSTITIDIGNGETLVGTLGDGRITFEDIMDSGVTLYFEKTA